MTTEEKIDQMIEVLTAYKEGKRIEARPKIDCLYTPYIWKDCAPVWDFANNDYRIQEPEEKIAMPATQEELDDIMSVVFIKDKKDKDIYSFMSSEVKTMGFKDKTVWYKFNPDTKCWEDWSEEG